MPWSAGSLGGRLAWGQDRWRGAVSVASGFWPGSGGLGARKRYSLDAGHASVANHSPVILSSGLAGGVCVCLRGPLLAPGHREACHSPSKGASLLVSIHKAEAGPLYLLWGESCGSSGGQGRVPAPLFCGLRLAVPPPLGKLGEAGGLSPLVLGLPLWLARVPSSLADQEAALVRLSSAGPQHVVLLQ